MDSKDMHQKTKTGKFSKEVHEGLQIMLPKLAKEYRRLESIHVKSIDPEKLENEQKLCAENIDVLFQDFNELEDHFFKIEGKKSKKRNLLKRSSR